MGMDYSKVSRGILREDSFCAEQLGKCESIMCLGNGYVGLRSATEEHYVGETRGMFIAGTFNKFDENEVTELPNCADMTSVDLFLNGERFHLLTGQIEEYSRELNIYNGELTRHIVWVSPSGTRAEFRFSRVVSLKQLHVFAQRIEIRAMDDVIRLKVQSGINGRMTNSGSQHFSDGDKRFFEKRFLQYIQTTTQSEISFIHTTTHKLELDGEILDMEPQIYIDRRYLYGSFELEIPKGKSLVIEKYSNVYTSRDRETEAKTVEELQQISLDVCKEEESWGYRKIRDESGECWEREVWRPIPIEIKGPELDQFAIHFAQYHMRLMVPSHDSRMNIGAKGLSGEGYKGHTFWDTEIFLLPYYIFTQPDTARKLEEYRYHSLPGAYEKARQNGYEGAMFPWESAWLDDGEVTPEYCDVDIITGKPAKVWSGFIEQHITADVAFGAWQYGICTGDEQYMEKYGYELIMDTATFWASRLEKEGDKYHINDVVGPDEFREHVNDNAFTNYMANWNMKKAMEYYLFLREKKPMIYERLNQKLNLDEAYRKWKDGVEHIFLPTPNSQNVLPQDDRYLHCRDIDLTKYKNQEYVGGITRDYNLAQINEIQVSKQADTLVLFFLLENEFAPEVKKASWEYYERRTIHDSSLSLSTHSVLASDMNEVKMAYELFCKAAMIDLGPYMGSSNAGIHAASFGGVWQCVVYGFGGVRMLDGKLRICPKLPREWESLKFTILWKGQKLAVHIAGDEVEVENLTKSCQVEVEINGRIKIL